MVAYDASHIHITRTTFDRDSAASEFANLPVAVIGDAIDRLGMCDAGIEALWPGAKCSGHAFPVLVREGDNAGIHAALEHVGAGDVLVVNGLSNRSRALVGERIAMRLKELGVRGMVVDGCVRDSAELVDMQFPVWSRGTSPAGPYKNGPAVIGEPVAVGGVVVSPGDVVAGDSDGVVIIPRERTNEVLGKARRIAEEERLAKEQHTANTTTS